MNAPKAVAVFLLGCGLASAAGASTVAGAAAPVSAAAAAPPAAAATQLISADQLREQINANRGKVIVLNFWATWCLPCLHEIPVLLQVTQQLAPRGVVLIGVAMDEPQALAQVEPFRKKHFPGFATGLRADADMDKLASVVDPTWNEILPTTYILGRNGKLRTKIQGARSAAQFRATIEAALRAGP